jgi:hypothetical protein
MPTTRSTRRWYVLPPEGGSRTPVNGAKRIIVSCRSDSNTPKGASLCLKPSDRNGFQRCPEGELTPSAPRQDRVIASRESNQAMERMESSESLMKTFLVDITVPTPGRLSRVEPREHDQGWIQSPNQTRSRSLDPGRGPKQVFS